MKKIICVLVCVVLVFSMVSFNALANTDTEVSINEGVNFSEFSGNSIRSESSDGKQGLRFKYTVDFSAYELYLNDGYTLEEIGILAIRDSFLDGESLLKNGVYNNNKANEGVFYSASKEINYLSQDNLASAVLVNIGYNVKTKTLNFSAYAEDYKTRMYTVLTKNDEQLILYDAEEKACVDIMKAIIDKYEATANPEIDEQLTADYQSVQTLLNSTVTDKNGKTVKQIYEGKYPAKPLAPTVASKTDTTVTLTAVDGYEYKLGDGEWQTSNVFTGLSPATKYNFYQRVAETDTSYASESSDASAVTTNNATPPATDDEGWTGDYIINTKPR